jgi:folate-dependent phosphoribosylglycinamide formyltransferase PurN
VDEEFDTGPIILQKVVSVEETTRRKPSPHGFCPANTPPSPEALALLAARKLRVEGGVFGGYNWA